MNPKDQQPRRGTETAAVGVPCLQGDAEAVAAFGSLLGSRQGGSRRWGLVGVEGVQGDRIRLGLRVGTRPYAIHLLPRDSARAFVRVPGLAVCYEGNVGGVMLEALTRRVAARLQSHSFRQLFRLLADHALPPPVSDSAPESALAPGSAAEPGSEPGSASTAGVATPDWCRFFVPRHCEDHEPNWVGDGVVLVEYSDRECFYSHKGLDPRKWASYNDPRIPLPSRGAVIPSVDCSLIQAELDEDAVIRGNLSLHDKLVEEARRLSNRAELLVVNHLCTPVVIGDDIARLSKRCEDAAGAPAFEITRTAKAQTSLFQKGLSRLLQEPGVLSQRADPHGVSLFGFGRRYVAEELEPWLLQLGLRVHASPLPDVDCDSLRRVPRAGLQVVMGPLEAGAPILEQLGRHGLRGCVVPAPYGPQATHRCITAIAEETGRLDAWAALWKERFDEFSSAWSPLRDQVAGERLGFVVAPESLGHLLAPPELGLDLLRVLPEFGFDVELLCYAPGDRLPTTLQERLDAHPEREALRCSTFGDPSTLRGLLGNRALRAVYSDYFFDQRLPASGKAQFSRRHLEPGLAGALRSLRALRAVIRVPFYERYARHLDSDAWGHHG